MKKLSQHLDYYLTIRRSLGYDLSSTERILRKFISFCDKVGQDYISTDLFLLWKANYGSASNSTWVARLGIIRGFSNWLVEYDERTEIPPSGLISGRNRRSRPYIYSKEEIARLIAAAGMLPSAYGLRACLWQTLFGLIAVTGLRINEALHLRTKNIDFDRALLTITKSKNGSGRFIPVCSSTVTRLAKYMSERDRLLGKTNDLFFLTEHGRPVNDCTARYNFAQISQQIGLRKLQQYSKHGIGPRIHDLRHTFAVHTILDWFREQRDIDHEMYQLSTYLGHTRPEYTYWYIEAIPELLQLASERAEQRYQGGKE